MVGAFAKSIETWEAAIAALPTNKLSPTEAKQKTEWTRGLSKAREKQRERQLVPPPPPPHPTQAPWLLATSIKHELGSNGKEGLRSSVHDRDSWYGTGY